MSLPPAADLQRWSAEVARDPGSPWFVPLARVFRRQGRREAALRLCLRGLEHNPTHLEAHLLLALLYVDGSDRDRAADEWGTVLRLQPDNVEAHRGMAFYHLERRDYARARPHLERAAAARPTDPTIREALQFVREREGRGKPARDGRAVAQGNGTATGAPTVTAASAEPGAAPASAAPVRASRDPQRVFEAMLVDAPFIGALILDRQGLVLAGTVRAGSGIDALGAVLGGAIDEAVRTARYLSLGGWRSILLEATEAIVHMSPLTADLAVLLAVRREAPTGWVLRSAARAQSLARAFLGAEG